MAELGSERGIQVILAAGRPNEAQAARSDHAFLAGQRFVDQREFSLIGKRLVVRKVKTVTADADFVVIEQARRNLDAYLLLARKRRSTPVALWGHGRDYTHDAGWVDDGIRKLLTKRADWFFAYTDGGCQAVTSEGFPRERVTVLNNAVDTSELRRGIERLSKIEIDQFMFEHGLHGPTALYLGGLDESKRIKFLLQSAVEIRARVPDFHLLVAGAGAEVEEVNRFVARHDWCSYLGPIRGQAKYLALAAAKVLTIPGRVGLVAVDSFAAGVPIITTSWPWHAPEFDYLKPGVNALVADNSLEGFVRTTVQALTDAVLLEGLANEASLSASVYSVENMAVRYIDGLESWIRGKHSTKKGR
ncbi:glycosyltransferase family 4 protein [Microbacterium testaceum]|uniref:glycosyltransferase family 4 protein n=1 Tax=Microbacterium testaceum TaxID=2033 RepID=UPI0019D3C174|nr:glycosyltransferase family 4 protein [Microbacterium testaceum]